MLYPERQAMFFSKREYGRFEQCRPCTRLANLQEPLLMELLGSITFGRNSKKRDALQR